MRTIIDDGTPHHCALIERELDGHWDEIEREIRERERMRDDDLLEADRALLVYIASRRARRLSEVA